MALTQTVKVNLGLQQSSRNGKSRGYPGEER
jgi:hypothetical protein